MEKDIEKVINAHRKYSQESKATRKWDNQTPYFIHPIWCALTLLHETNLPSGVRENGYQALLYHDVLEDTKCKLPKYLSPEVRELITEMTTKNSEKEMREVWSKKPEVKLLRLYDKVSNLMDSTWMSPKKKERYVEYVKRLKNEVEQTYGDLNIVRIAKAITDVRTENK